MSAHQTIRFGEFELDPEGGSLRKRGVPCTLRAKTLAVLCHLASHPGRLVTHEELKRAVWRGVSVSRTVLRVCIREIRAALGDDGANCVVTVPGRGHRFVRDPDRDAFARPFVGREAELARLHEVLALSDRGLRQVVLVLGDAGSGKSRLVERFLDDVRNTGRARIATGQCLELHGGLEAYAPLLDLLGRLRGDADRDGVESALTEWAPSWLAQLPGFAGAATVAERSEDVPRQTPGRMLRELTGLFEALAANRPLVLVLEDVQWNDASTIDAIAHLAQRDVLARLLIVCTRRPIDPGPSTEPLRLLEKSLHERGRCEQIRMHALGENHVQTYLTARLAPHCVDHGVAHALHRSTGGHPLFLVAMTEHLLVTRALAVVDGKWCIVKRLEGVIPDAVETVVATSLQRVPPSRRRILEAASVAGAAFPVAAISAAVGLSIDATEDVCEEFVESGRLLRAGIETWPDGSMSGRYQFSHALHAEVLYRRLSDSARARLHLAVGEAIAAGHGEHVATVAALLARHFTLAGDIERGWQFHRKAARSAAKRFASHEAIAHLEAALALLRTLPDSEAHTLAELRCTLHLCENLATVGGFASDAVRVVHERARDLGGRVALVPAQIVGVAGLFAHHSLRGEISIARGLAEQLAVLAAAEPAFSTMAHGSLGSILFNLGDLAGARAHLEQAVADPNAPKLRLTLDSLTTYRCFLALTLLLQGDLRQAAKGIDVMVDDAATLHRDPFRLAHAHSIAAQFHATAGDRLATGRHAELAIALADEHAFTLNASATIVRGWAGRDANAVRRGIEDDARIGNRLSRPLYEALLAETLLEQGDVEAATSAIDRALLVAAETGEEHHLAELHRLRGECLLRGTNGERYTTEVEGKTAAAHASFGQALSVARRQGARLFELRAAISVCSAPRRPRSSIARLRKIHDAFDKSRKCPELSAAHGFFEADSTVGRPVSDSASHCPTAYEW
ncbi:MAG: AAA family ATPase [bacterium]